jgi:hypothetical protein
MVIYIMKETNCWDERQQGLLGYSDFSERMMFKLGLNGKRSQP